MEDAVKTYIKTNAFLGMEINLGENLPVIKCPTIKELGDKFLIYLSYATKYIELYDEKKHGVYFEIIKDENSIAEFAFFVKFFAKFNELGFKGGDFLFDDWVINYENITLFVETIRVLHHGDKKYDNYKVSAIAQKHIDRARKAKKKVEAQISMKNNISLHEIMSAICARHPSINPLNIADLSYYQLIEQYKRLGSIDKYMPCLYGNATEDYIKKNNVSHYVSKIEND